MRRALSLVVIGLLASASAHAQSLPEARRLIEQAQSALAEASKLLGPPTINVPATGNLQTALDEAAPGTTIELAQGATYTGNFILRNKAGAEPVTIRTAGLSDAVLPPTQRITMAETRLAKLTCFDCFYPILRADPGTHDVQIVAVQLVGYVPAPGRIGPAVPDRDMVQFGIGVEGVNWYTTPAQILSNITFDRVQFTAGVAGGHRAALLDGRNMQVINSDCRGFWEIGRDSQCFTATQGPGPYLISNNYIEAASENVIFGGNDPVMAGAIPRSIVIRGNHFSKPDAWRGKGRQVKNLLELKNAVDVLIEYNLFEHTWTDAQAGNAIFFTVRNQDGKCTWCEVSDVTFQWNVVRDVEGFAIAILGADYTHPSGTSKNIVIDQNLFLSVGHGITSQGPVTGLTITHNTMLGIGGTPSPTRDRGRFLNFNGPPTAGLIVRDNVVQGGDYGITGTNTAPGVGALVAFAPSASLTHNVIELTAVRQVSYPGGNFLIAPGSLTPQIGADSGYLPMVGQAASDGRPLGVDAVELRRRVAW